MRVRVRMRVRVGVGVGIRVGPDPNPDPNAHLELGPAVAQQLDGDDHLRGEARHERVELGLGHSGVEQEG